MSLASKRPVFFNFQLKQLNTLHKAFEGYGKAVDDDDPLPPTQKPRGYGGVATLYRNNIDLKIQKCLDGGNRIVVSERHQHSHM